MGASIIYVDLVIRLIPGRSKFRIQDSNAFLACSLSLSFGVMIFSALYSMLPSSMRYLIKDEWDKQSAGLIMMSCFVGGFFGIQIVSRFMHQFMPSHVVDCHHTHSDHPANTEDFHHSHGRGHSTSRSRPLRRISTSSDTQPHMTQVNGFATESTPLLPSEVGYSAHTHQELSNGDSVVPHVHGPGKDAHNHKATAQRRPSMVQVQNKVMSFGTAIIKDTKPDCDEYGPCYGYSEPCGLECRKNLKDSRFAALPTRSSSLLRTATGTILSSHHQHSSAASTVDDRDEDSGGNSHHGDDSSHSHHNHHHHSHANDEDGGAVCFSPIGEEDGNEDIEDIEAQAQHHHHVPANAFLSIGLQTVIAIALHKLPEGFITYATNHVSSSLGFNVFMALFVHNIAEGFAMALPLYLALDSRSKAIAWSSLLGGLSQPLGAGIAVLWFKVANRSSITIDNTFYGCTFGITAGIMTSVALQLFMESLSLDHNRNLSMLFAFLGMALLGFSNALV